MQENEIIIVEGVPAGNYDSLVENCVRYAIISLPFTVNRMSITEVKKRATNIAKGKISEALFRRFCDTNSIWADFELCSTIILPIFRTGK